MLLCCVVLFFFAPLIMSSGEGRRGPVPFRFVVVGLCPFCIVRSPCEVLVSCLRVLLLQPAAVLKVCCYCKER